MQDRVLAALIFVPVTIIVMLIGVMVVMDYLEQEPRNPVGEIPKVILDHSGNETLVTVKAVGEHKYDSIYINYTVGNRTEVVSAQDRYVLDANVSEPEFVLNITVWAGENQYMYNCTVYLEMRPDEPVYVWIVDEGDTDLSRHRTPYEVLAEWREVK